MTSKYIRVSANVSDTFKINAVYSVAFGIQESTGNVQTFLEVNNPNDGIYQMYNPYTNDTSTTINGEAMNVISYITQYFSNTESTELNNFSSSTYYAYIYTVNDKNFGNVTYTGEHTFT